MKTSWTWLAGALALVSAPGHLTFDGDAIGAPAPGLDAVVGTWPVA